jgi:hypothetical protein
MLVMNDLGTITEFSKAHTVQTRSINFVIRPELRRTGDSEGELFDHITTVAGCEGEMVVISYS